MKKLVAAVVALTLSSTLSGCGLASKDSQRSRGPLPDKALQQQVADAVFQVDLEIRAAAKQRGTTSQDINAIMDATAKGVLAGDFKVRLLSITNAAITFWREGGQAVVAEDLAPKQEYLEITYLNVAACLKLSQDDSAVTSIIPATKETEAAHPRSSMIVSVFGCHDGHGHGDWD